MATERHLAAVAQPPTDSAQPAPPSGVPTSEALASFLRRLANRRGRSGRITSPETVCSYTSALPTAFAGITDLGELGDAGRDQLHANIRAAWGGKAPSTFNAKRAAVGSALATSTNRTGSATRPRSWPDSTGNTSPSRPTTASAPANRSTG
jgi:integrase/recombinase XerC